MVKKHMHRSSVIRDTQIGTTERHHCIPTGTTTTAIKEKPGRPTCGVGVRKGSPLSLPGVVKQCRCSGGGSGSPSES